MVFPMVSISFKIKWFLFKEDGLSWSLKVGKLKLKVVVPFGLRFLLRFFGGAACGASPHCGTKCLKPAINRFISVYNNVISRFFKKQLSTFPFPVNGLTSYSRLIKLLQA